MGNPRAGMLILVGFVCSFERERRRMWGCSCTPCFPLNIDTHPRRGEKEKMEMVLGLGLGLRLDLGVGLLTTQFPKLPYGV